MFSIVQNCFVVSFLLFIGLQQPLIASDKIDELVDDWQVCEPIERGWQSDDINAQDEISGFTRLHVAALNAQLHEVKRLVEGGADVNILAGDGYGSALNHAFELIGSYSMPKYDRVKVIEYLLEKGANCHMKNHAGIYPVQAAAASGDVRLMSALIATMKLHGNLVEGLNVKDSFDRTPLDEAIYHANQALQKPEIRKKHYAMCGILQAEGAPQGSFQVLMPQPTDEAMLGEYEAAQQQRIIEHERIVNKYGLQGLSWVEAVNKVFHADEDSLPKDLKK